MGILLFVIYIIFLVYFLFFSEEYGRAAETQRVYRYNLIPFVEIGSDSADHQSGMF